MTETCCFSVRFRRTPVQFVAEIGEVHCNGQPFFWSLKPSSCNLFVSELLTQLARSPLRLLRGCLWLRFYKGEYTWV